MNACKTVSLLCQSGAFHVHTGRSHPEEVIVNFVPGMGAGFIRVMLSYLVVYLQIYGINVTVGSTGREEDLQRA